MLFYLFIFLSIGYDLFLFIRKMVPGFGYILKGCLGNTGNFPVLLPLGDHVCLGIECLFCSISYLLVFVGIG